MNNTRFATAIHILTLLDKSGDAWLTSEWIAGSININAVIVRKEIIGLKKIGLIESRKGKEGGVRLAKPASKIYLSEIYSVVKNAELLGKKNQNPNPDCVVGKGINKQLDKLYLQIDSLVEHFLKVTTLKNFSNKIK